MKVKLFLSNKNIRNVALVLSIYCITLSANISSDSLQVRALSRDTSKIKHTLPISNGYAGAEYAINSREFINFYPHIYASYSQNQKTNKLISSIKPIITYKGKALSLNRLQSERFGYLPGTSITEHVMRGDNFKYTQFGFCPFYINRAFWVLYFVVESAEVDQFALNIETNKESPRVNIGKWSYAEGNKRWLCIIISSKQNSGGGYQDVNSFHKQHPGFEALLKEIKWWETWHESTIDPKIPGGSKQRYYYQAVTTLKMSQCRESGKPKGQILATLQPGRAWTYLMDQCYATQAFLKSGHFQEAREALQFVLNNKAGKYKTYYWFNTDYGIGRDYLLSVSKYFGNGEETSDSTETGPNIELAGFGLVLSNIEDYVKTTRDIKFLRYYWEKIRYQIADVLLHSIDNTGLIRKDSGPWRIHLPGKHFTYTSICAYRGLLATNWMATKMGEEKYAGKCQEAAHKIRESIEGDLFRERQNILKGNLEGRIPEQYADGSVIESINFIFSPQDRISQAALNTINQYLRKDNSPFYTNKMHDDNFKDNLFINLRLALALQILRKNQLAEQIIEKIMIRSNKYGFALPAFYIDGRPDGKGPMIGRGAANIILYYGENNDK